MYVAQIPPPPPNAVSQAPYLDIFFLVRSSPFRSTIMYSGLVWIYILCSRICAHEFLCLSVTGQKFCARKVWARKSDKQECALSSVVASFSQIILALHFCFLHIGDPYKRIPVRCRYAWAAKARLITRQESCGPFKYHTIFFCGKVSWNSPGLKTHGRTYCTYNKDRFVVQRISLPRCVILKKSMNFNLCMVGW